MILRWKSVHTTYYAAWQDYWPGRSSSQTRSNCELSVLFFIQINGDNFWKKNEVMESNYMRTVHVRPGMRSLCNRMRQWNLRGLCEQTITSTWETTWETTGASKIDPLHQFTHNDRQEIGWGANWSKLTILQISLICLIDIDAFDFRISDDRWLNFAVQKSKIILRTIKSL